MAIFSDSQVFYVNIFSLCKISMPRLRIMPSGAGTEAQWYRISEDIIVQMPIQLCPGCVPPDPHFLIMAWGKLGRWNKCLSPCHHVGDQEKSPRHTLAWPTSGHLGHFGVNKWLDDESFSVFNSFV